MMPYVGDNSDNAVRTLGQPRSLFSTPARPSGDKLAHGKGHATQLPNGVVSIMNGKLPNGNVVRPAAPNGHAVQPATADKATTQEDMAEYASRALSLDGDAPYKSPEGRGNSGDLPSRDDGYFASVYSTEQDDSCRTTKVHMGVLGTADSKKEAQRDFKPPAKHSSEAANPQPQHPHPHSSETSLQVPNSSYRVSSPAAFNHSTPAPSQQPHRLQHRHTLEVPKASAARSRDFQNSHSSTDDVVTATGRFSPNTPTRRRGSMSLARRATRSVNSDMHLEEPPQDEDAARWAEHYRQKRASKRKRREDEDDDRVVVGTKVDQHHVNWVTAYNMLTGIRFVVSRTNAKMDRELTDADFEAKHKFSFDM
jgi:1-phosphatidylinositol-4-phosphate 5-kinase